MTAFRVLSMALLVLSALAGLASDAQAASSEIKLVPDAPAARNEFGNSVAIDGDWAVVGDQVDDFGGVPTGAAYVFRRTASGWSQVATLTSGLQDDAFGLSVDISGSSIVVGAWGDNGGRGAAYVFERSKGTDQWDLAAKLTVVDPVPGELFGDRFGFSVSIHRRTIAVGALLADTAVDLNTGAVFVFEKALDQQWHEVQKLWPGDAHRGMQFGESVAVSTCRVLVGAPWTRGVQSQSGAAYLFDSCDDDGWREASRLGGAPLDSFFGTAVALDRGLAVVGANANNEHGTFTGAAYVFEQNAGGLNAWGRLATLAAFDPRHDKNFGYSVAVDGGIVVVGAPGDDHTSFNAGAVYVFRRHAGGRDRFGATAKLTASDSSFGFEYFGWSVDVNEATAVVGAPTGGTEPFTGAAYVYAVAEREPVCRVAAASTGDVVMLDFRLGTTVPAHWSVWTWIAGQRYRIWQTPLGVVNPPIDLSVPLDIDFPGAIAFLSVLSTGENAVVCADWDRVGPRMHDENAERPTF